MLGWKTIPSQGREEGCVVTLHGRGVTGEDLMPLAEEVGLTGLRWIFPDGPLAFPGPFGGRMWYDIGPDSHDGILESRTLLFDLIQHLAAQGLPADRIALFGFSQGAVMALDVGVRHPMRLAGVVVLSGYLALPETLQAEKSPAADGLPILMAHGTDDEVLPVSGARQAEARLRAEGFSVRYLEYPMGHQIVPEELAEVRTFLRTIVSRSPGR